MKLQEDAKKRQHIDALHPVKRAARDKLLVSTGSRRNQVASSNAMHEAEDVEDATGTPLQEVFHGDALDETWTLSVFGNFMVRKLEARRNIFEAST